MTSLRRRVSALALATVLGGCGAEGSGPASPPLAALPGVSVLQRLTGLEGEGFFDHPWPSDLRLDAEGRPRLAGFPVPPTNLVVAPLLEVAGERGGYAVTSTAYFRFDGPVRPVAGEPFEGLGAEIALVDVDPGSPERGRVVPAVAETPPADAYVPEHLLAVGPLPGLTLRPRTLHAVLVRRALGDASGALLGAPAALRELLAGGAPEELGGERARALHAPALSWLAEQGVAADDVAAVTVFTTGDAVADDAELHEKVLAAHGVTVQGLELDPTDGAHADFCELHGWFEAPQFQRGVPPFDEQGTLALDADGTPVEVRRERVPLVVSLPRAEMPAGGFPVVVYVHGSGGLSTQSVDRGPIAEPGGAPRAGEGPALVLARRGFAVVSPAMPLNPERLPGAAPRAYLNTDNLAAYRDTFRQGVLELRLLARALDGLRIGVAALGACAVPGAGAEVRLDARRVLLLGQSMGAQYVTLVGATDPLVSAVVPTGSGGHFPLLASLGTRELPSTVFQLLVGTRERLTPRHPAFALLGLAWEPVEPVVAAPRLSRLPLPGHAPRDVFHPVAEGDGDFPEPVFDAMALAYGTVQAGEEVWPSMQEALARDGRGGVLPLPVQGNRVTTGVAWTGVVAQYRGDGLADPHTVFSQLAPLKHQYGCFLYTHVRAGRATLLPGVDLDAPCR